VSVRRSGCVSKKRAWDCTRARKREREEPPHRRQRETFSNIINAMELHRASFVEWQPTSVVAVKATSSYHGGKCVALARENGDMEIYDAHSWRLIGRVPGKDGDAITRLEWLQPFRVDHEMNFGEDDDNGGDGGSDGDDEDDGLESLKTGVCPPARLVSVALDGTVTEWDLNSLKPHSTCESHGGSIWDCASEPMEAVKHGQPQRLAIACDDGCVRLVISMAKSAVGGGLRHKETLPKVSGKVLSVCWNKDGTRIAAGTSEGRIHVFDVELKREIECILIGNQPPKQSHREKHRNPNSLKKKRNRVGSDVSRNHDPTCVWKMLYLPDDTLVTADSDGNVTFYDSRFYTVLKRFPSHDADVVALAVAPNGRIVFASGVDHKIVAFENLDEINRNEKGFNEWVQTSMKRPHTHDVKCLEMLRNSKVPGGVLLSAGVDAQLLAHRADAFGKKHPVRVVSVPRKTPIAVTSTAMHTFNDSSLTTTPVGTPSNGNGATLSERSNGFTCPDPPLAMCEHGRYVDVWKLGEALGTTTASTSSQHQQENINTSNARKKQRIDDNTPNKKNRQLLRSAPECVLRLFVSGRHSILCSAISPDGCWVVLSDAVSPPRIFAIREPNSKEKEEMNSDDEEEEAFFDGATDVKRKSGWRAKKVEMPEEITRPAAHLLFTADAKRLIIVSINGPIKIIDLENWEVVGTLRAHIATKTATQRAFAKESGRRRLQHRHQSGFGGFQGGEGNMVTADTVGCPAVTNICCSGDSQWLAVASCRAPNVVSDADNAFSANANVGGVFIYSMDAMKLHSRLPPPLNMDSWSAIHAMAFNETRVLAIACGTSNSLWTIDVETGEPLPWSLNLAKRNAHAPDALYNTPGQICGLSFAIGGGGDKEQTSSKRGGKSSSAKKSSANKDARLPELVLFAHTPNAIARIDLRAKITDDCVLSKLGKSKVLTGSAKKKRRQREKQLKEKQASQHVNGASELPGGVKSVILNDPCLFFGTVGKNKALLVERPWVDVLRKMQKPLYRHRFGT